MATKAAVETTIDIRPIEARTINIGIVGTRPLILNRLSNKAKQELLMPKGRKTTAERASSLKHNPIQEFNDAPELIDDENAPTLLGFPAAAFKKGMSSAALRVPGVRKAEINQLVWVEGDLTPIYGVPQMLMSVTRSADMNRTPDIRTRVIVPEWATVIAVTFTVPILNDTSVANLLSAAGTLCGIGDWRTEKGSGTYGQYRITNPDTDEEFKRIVAGGGRAVQVAGMEAAEPYNRETEELFSWFTDELKTRGKAA